MKNDYVDFKTLDNTIARVRKSSVSAIEEIPSSARVEGYLKIYAGGFAFHVKLSLDEATQVIYGQS
jgi:hypothetical protein